ncbi:hypothetical protein CYY_005245 [Polysphondylium violaceum]|uniref:FNIP repeat-containing protein n=1 Tax=Polysphondylium violaceum TaxID=133409 RepID=A0A8J4PS21_9MYCE|nr:hypothetical protein CYY_005245 [Polysphondylium violaceum]
MQPQLFFSIFRNRYLKQKIFISSYDYYIIKNISHLEKQYDHLCLLNSNNIPVVYYIPNIDHYHIYCSHKHKSLITHIIVSSHFYEYHYHNLLQESQPLPILFGLTITDRERDPIILANKLPPSVQYYKYRIGGSAYDGYPEPIQKGLIPESVTYLHLGLDRLDADVLPNKVKTLVLTLQSIEDLPKKCFTLQSIEYSPKKCEFNGRYIPRSVNSFTLYDYHHKFNDLDINLLPTNLTYLNVNGNIKNHGFGSLKYLSMTCSDICPKINIPNSVTHLKLLNRQMDKKSIHLSPNLTFLHLGRTYQEYKKTIPIPEPLPRNLKTLRLEQYSNKAVTKSNCPANLLSYSNVNTNEDKYLPYIPPRATKVSICFSHRPKTKQQIPQIVPLTVTDLKMNFPYHDIPKRYFGNNIVKLDLTSIGDLTPDTIPPSVTALSMNLNPTTIEKLNSGLLSEIIPNGVIKLVLICNHSVVPKSMKFPDTVTSLSISSYIPNAITLVPTSGNLKTLKVSNLDFKTFSLTSLPPTLSKLCTSTLGSNAFQLTYGIVCPNYDNSKFPSNIKQVKFKNIHQYGFDHSFHFIDGGKVYAETHKPLNPFLSRINKI